MGQWRVLRRRREQPVPSARDCVAWISRDRQRPHPEWSRRSAAREPRPAPQQGQLPPPRTQASDLTDADRLGVGREHSAQAARTSAASIRRSRVFGVELRRFAGAPGRERSARKDAGLHNTGILNDGPARIPGMDVRKDVLQTLHTPVIYILGGPKDIAYQNGMDDFSESRRCRSRSPISPVGHGGTFLEPNGGAAASVAVSWLDWQLRGDTQSARRFVGEDCGLCRDASGRCSVNSSPRPPAATDSAAVTALFAPPAPRPSPRRACCSCPGCLRGGTRTRRPRVGHRSRRESGSMSRPASASASRACRVFSERGSTSWPLAGRAA